MGTLTRMITDTGVIRALAIDGRDIAEEARRIHRATPVAAAALGRTLMAASLMGSLLKSENESLTLRIDGGGPLGKLIACADAAGNVRGMAANPGLALPLRSDGKLDVGRAVGTDGYLAVSKDFGSKEPYISRVPLVSGEIAEDVTHYFAVSEQTGTACALGVLVGGDGSVRAAGGYLVQLLPNVRDDEIIELERLIKKAPPITGLLSKGASAAQALETVMEGFRMEQLGTSEVLYRCGCSAERVERALIALGPEELAELEGDMREKEETHLEVGCEFCDRKYRARFSKGRLIVDGL